jgi:uncharacterized membrane protein
MGAEDNSERYAELAARVAALERQVAELTAAAKPGSARTAIYRETGVVSVETMPVASRSAPPPLPLVPPPPSESLESRLGSQVFNVVGILAILAGTSYFLKLAIERGWVGPVARVLIGLVAGAGLVLWSERFRRGGLKAFSYSLKALGSAVLYLSLWASFQLYHQLPAGVALAAMVLAGGFLTPLLLSTGGDHEAFLFTYIAAIDLAIVLLMRWKPWRRLLVPALAGTVGYFCGYYSQFFHALPLQGFSPTLRLAGRGWDGQSTETAMFALVFFAVFAAVSVKGFSEIEESKGAVIVPVLVPLSNAAFLACALYSVFEDSGLHTSLAWVMVGLAALCLGLARVQATAVAGAMHLASAVVFLTIAIPLKASGHSLTTAWLVEGLALYWASTRVEAKSGAPAKVLTWLSMAGFGLGLTALVIDHLWVAFDVPFFNAALGSALTAVAALAGAAWLAAGRRDAGTLGAALIAIDLVGVLLSWREVGASWFTEYERGHAAFANAEFATALVGLTVLAGVVWVGYRVAEVDAPIANAALDGGRGLAGATLVVFNLLAILSVVREIGALWRASAETLERSLAVSAFLMLYGGALLAVGFWRRSAFVRWQGLILLIFTIAKVFLWDIGGLSQGYRVASFLGLGALLMGVSFAYQKDWLGLKQPGGGDR